MLCHLFSEFAIRAQLNGNLVRVRVDAHTHNRSNSNSNASDVNVRIRTPSSYLFFRHCLRSSRRSQRWLLLPRFQFPSMTQTATHSN